MPGRVEPLSMPLRLSLDNDIPGGTEEVVVLVREFDGGRADEATLRIGVADVALDKPTAPGFVVEVRPVYTAVALGQDILGNPVASISIAEISNGLLLTAAFSPALVGPVQVSIRCGQPATGIMRITAYIDVVLKWQNAAPQRIGDSEGPMVRKHAASSSPTATTLSRLAAAMAPAARPRLAEPRKMRADESADEALQQLRAFCQATEDEGISVDSLLRAAELTPLSRGIAGMMSFRRRLARDAAHLPREKLTRPTCCGSEQCSSRQSAAVGACSQRSSQGRAALDSRAGSQSPDPDGYSDVLIRVVRTQPNRGILGLFRTRGRCVPRAATDCASRVRQTCFSDADVRPAGSSEQREMITDEVLTLKRSAQPGRPHERAQSYMPDIPVWVGGTVRARTTCEEIEIVPVELGCFDPGAYSLEIEILGEECVAQVRGISFYSLPALAQPDESNQLGPYAFDSIPWGSSSEGGLEQVELFGDVYFPAHDGHAQGGPIVVVLHGRVDSCLTGGENSSALAVAGMSTLLKLLAANGFIAAGIEGPENVHGALAALGFLRDVSRLPMGPDVPVMEIPNICAFIGHSRAASRVAEAASYVNRIAFDPGAIDPWLKPGNLLGEPMVAYAAVGFSGPPDAIPVSIAADVPWLLMISGSQDGDVDSGKGVDTFDRFSSIGDQDSYPFYQANVWVHGLRHLHFFDSGVMNSGFCDADTIAEDVVPHDVGNQAIAFCCVAFLLAATFKTSKLLPFFQTKNLVAVDGVLGDATEVLWRLPMWPSRFFDLANGAAEYSASGGVSVMEGSLTDLAATELDAYNMPHSQTLGLLVEWTASDEPVLEFALQGPGAESSVGTFGDFSGIAGTVVQISGAIPPDGIPNGVEVLGFEVGLKTMDGDEYFADLENYGGWRRPDPVALAGGIEGVATAVVLSTVSIPLAAFSQDADVLRRVNRVILRLSSAVSDGRFFLASIYQMPVIGQ